jgi:uncharacterized protein (DUF427 family)
LTRPHAAEDRDDVAIEVAEQWLRGLGELRYQPMDKRVRALIGGQTVVDSVRPALVWEPRRVVPCYAVPERDVLAALVPTPAGSARSRPAGPAGFRPHTTAGQELGVRAAGGRTLVGAAFRPTDPDLAGHVVLDFDAFDTWLEEDEVVAGHPRDPFHRVDVRRSSRHVRVMLGERVLADSHRPSMVFETLLPVRFYLPREDVEGRLLRPSTRRTVCAYKGRASYWSVRLDTYLAEDLAWSYEEPLAPAAELAGLICFFDERVDMIVDDVRRERPVPVWS